MKIKACFRWDPVMENHFYLLIFWLFKNCTALIEECALSGGAKIYLECVLLYFEARWYYK